MRACKANMAATLCFLFYCAEKYLWRSDWLKLLRWLTAWISLLPLVSEQV